MPRDSVMRNSLMQKVRTALGRRAGEGVTELPAARIRIPQVEVEERVKSLLRQVEALAGHGVRTGDPLAYVAKAIAGKTAVASNAPFLRECGITELPGVRTGFMDREELKQACSTADFGITSADYALADTGTLVMLASPQEQRLVSLLPPAHIAVVPKGRVLSGLDELFELLPNPSEQTSSMVLITGPSRTADIEQILVRGVHGPGVIHVVVVE